MVPGGGIEPPTRGFSIPCETCSISHSASQTGSYENTEPHITTLKRKGVDILRTPSVIDFHLVSRQNLAP